MKVISKADGSKWKHEVQCKNCLSLLEVYGCDLKYNAATCGNGLERGSAESFIATCAICSNRMYIDPDIINDVVKALLRANLKVEPPKEEKPYSEARAEDFYNK